MPANVDMTARVYKNNAKRLVIFQSIQLPADKQILLNYQLLVEALGCR